MSYIHVIQLYAYTCTEPTKKMPHCQAPHRVVVQVSQEGQEELIEASCSPDDQRSISFKGGDPYLYDMCIYDYIYICTSIHIHMLHKS